MNRMLFFILIGILSVASSAQAQFSKQEIGYHIVVAQFATNSGHGTATEIKACLCENEHHLDIGILGKPAKKQICGTSASYYYSLNPHTDDLMVSAFSKFIYRWKQALSDNVESLVYKEAIQKNTFSTFEAYAGMAVHFAAFPRILLGSNLGVGIYQRSIQEANDYRINNYIRYSPDCSLSMLFSLKITYLLN